MAVSDVVRNKEKTTFAAVLFVVPCSLTLTECQAIQIRRLCNSASKHLKPMRIRHDVVIKPGPLSIVNNGKDGREQRELFIVERHVRCLD